MKHHLLAHLHPEVRFYEEVRVWMAKYDAEDRQSRGEPIPEEIQRLLGQLLAESTVSGDVLEALRKLLNEEPTKATRTNIVRQRAFSERITELMNKYTNQQRSARRRSSPS